MSLPPDFRDLLVEFAREGVEYALIGRTKGLPDVHVTSPM